MDVKLEADELRAAIRLFAAGKIPKPGPAREDRNVVGAVHVRSTETGATLAFASAVGRMQVQVVGDVAEPGEAFLPAQPLIEWVSGRTAPSPIEITVDGAGWTARQKRSTWSSMTVPSAPDPTPLDPPADARQLVLPAEGIAALKRLTWALLHWQPADPFFFVQAQPGWLAATDKSGKYVRFALPDSTAEVGLPPELPTIAAHFSDDVEFLASNRMLWVRDCVRLVTLSTGTLSSRHLGEAIGDLIAVTDQAPAFKVESSALSAAVGVARMASRSTTTTNDDRVSFEWDGGLELRVSGAGTKSQASAVEVVEVEPMHGESFEGLPFPASALQDALREAGKEVEVRLHHAETPLPGSRAVIRAADFDGFEAVVASFAG